MEFHTFGDRKNKAVVLIHGVLTPWQIWEKQISVLQDRYYVVVPALDGHIEEYPSEYISVADEAEKIGEYVKRELDGGVFAVCGLSMGGVIAYELFKRGDIDIGALILDGAPLIKISVLAEKIMANAYKSIIHKSKERDKKTLENFKRDFLPERFLPYYLRFADTMSDSSVVNMIHSVCAGALSLRGGVWDTKILYLHGTKGNEVYSVKTAKMMKRLYPDMEIKRFDGYKHAELAVYKPDEWLDAVKPFLDAAE